MKMNRLLLICVCSLCIASVDAADIDRSVSDAPAMKPGTADAQTPSEQEPEPEQIRFDIWEFQVSGNTVLDDTLVERAVYPFLGKQKTVEDVDAASIALQSLFKYNGYPTVLVDIPQQDVSNGIVRLDIIQGKIDRLRISGSRYFSLAEIRSMVPALAVGEVPHLPTVQEQLQRLNATNKDLKVTPIFRPGRSPGTVSVELRVKDHSPVHGSLELNGRNSFGTTRTRLVANISYANLWLANHDLSLTYQTSPQKTDEVRVLVGSYVIPVGDDNSRLAIYGVRSDSETGVAASGAVSVVGKGKIAGARFVKPLKGEDRFMHSMVFGIDYKNFDELVGLVGADDIVTPIDYTMFSLDYNTTAISDSSITSFTGSVKFAPRAAGNDPEEFENKRFEANPNFSIANMRLSQEYRFDSGIKLIGIAAGQYAGQALISNEQYSVGGADTVRGYYESQVLADDALRASVELQSGDIAYLKKKGFVDAHLKVFVDGAATRIHDPLQGTDNSEQITGAGLGLRLATRENFKLSVDIATALRDNKQVESGDVRAHFTVRGTF